MGFTPYSGLGLLSAAVRYKTFVSYPHYEELIAEMKAVNAKLVIYANHLKKMIEI